MARDYSDKRGAGRGGKRGDGRSGGANGARRKPARRRPAARKPARQPAPAAGTPGWVWLFFGLTVGVLMAIGVYIFTRPTHDADRLVRTPVPIGEPGAATAPETAPAEPALPPAPDPRFAFYDMLPQYQIVIPKTEQRSPEQKRDPEVNNPGVYVIQVASFKDYAAADAMKARLALLGIEADIQEAKLSTGQTWYRVRIGPEQDTDRINTILARLQENQIDSMLMRVSQSG